MVYYPHGARPVRLAAPAVALIILMLALAGCQDGQETPASIVPWTEPPSTMMVGPASGEASGSVESTVADLPGGELADLYARVEILGVEFAADGAYVMIDYLAPPKLAGTWAQGMVSVVDESNGAVYGEIAVMPVVGPLFGKPKEDGQPGYVMLVNNAPGVRPGALVTVHLGQFVQEHVKVVESGESVPIPMVGSETSTQTVVTTP